MQTLYTLSAMEKEVKSGEPQALLQRHFDQTKSLLIYLIYFLSEVTRYAEKDAHKKAGKHLPSYSDLNVNIKIAGNEILWKMLGDPALQEAFKKEKPELSADPELLKKIYTALTETSEYKTYVAAQSRDKTEEKKIIEFILNDLMLANEIFISHIEDHFPNWDDDGDMLVQLFAGYMQKPGSFNFNQLMSADKASFAKSLLQTVVDKDAYLHELIVPKLKNWDPERIAHLDMIMMKMGVAEFLYFETIPPKVTINEYIDLAKEYSTVQSGQFVNGILDNIHKELVLGGKMQKVDYKKISNG